MESLLQQDPEMVTWWGSRIECWSALMRLVRDGDLTADGERQAGRRLQILAASWDEVAPTEAIRRTAERMLRVHALRSADALQLAAAMVASDHDPGRLEMVCLDHRLAAAARKEGFPEPG